MVVPLHVPSPGPSWSDDEVHNASFCHDGSKAAIVCQAELGYSCSIFFYDCDRCCPRLAACRLAGALISMAPLLGPTQAPKLHSHPFLLNISVEHLCTEACSCKQKVNDDSATLVRNQHQHGMLRSREGRQESLATTVHVCVCPCIAFSAFEVDCPHEQVQICC